MVFSLPLADADVLAPGLPATIAVALADATPILRLLAGLPDDEAGAGWLRD